MKNRHLRVCQTVFFVLVVATILSPPPAYCYIVPIVPEKVVEVIVTLEANPSSGAVPLSVKFTSTAKAIIHYADEVDEDEGGGSVDPREPLYRDEPLTPDKPEDQIIEDPGTYTFTATAEYEGKKGEASVTVVATKTDTDCDKVRKEWAKAVIDARNARHSYDEAKVDADRIGEMLANPAATIKDFEMRINNLKNLLKPDTPQENRDLILKAIEHLEAELKDFINNRPEWEKRLKELKDKMEKSLNEAEENKKNADELQEKHPECFPLA